MSTKLELDADNVFEATMSVAEARAYFDGTDLPPAVVDELDKVQGFVHEKGSKAFLVIEIKPVENI
jgi:hypothetical protein